MDSIDWGLFQRQQQEAQAYEWLRRRDEEEQAGRIRRDAQATVLERRGRKEARVTRLKKIGAIVVGTGLVVGTGVVVGLRGASGDDHGTRGRD